MKTERITQMEKFICEQNVVTISELLDRFQISTSTLRRDLDELERHGKIKKIYGGAKQAESTEKPPVGLMTYDERAITNQQAKSLIARRAAEMISENDTIFIDTGSSTVPLLQYLQHFKHLTIVTNSILVLSSTLNMPQFTVIGLPGVVKNKTASLIGEQCVHMLERYRFHKAFMACSSFSLSDGASNSSVEEHDIKRKVMTRSLQKYLLVDASKFGRSSLLSFASPRDFNCIITDKEPDPDYVQYFREYNIQLIVTEDDGGMLADRREDPSAVR